jgi:single-strand DNA-binding protein
MNTSSIKLIGNLTRDPEVQTLPSGAMLAKFSVACERRWMQDKEWQSETSFFNVVAWRDKAEMAEKLLEQGMRVTVDGTLKQRSYEDKDGNNRSAVEVTADEIAIGLWSLESVVRRAPQAAQQSTPREPAPSEAPF